MSPSDLHAIVTAARSLQERLECSADTDSEGEPVDNENRIATWCKSAAAGDERLFQKRLELDGFDKPALRRIFRNKFNEEQVYQEAWSETLAAIVYGPVRVPPQREGLGELRFADTIDMIARAPAALAFDSNAPLPFEDVWMPVLDTARRKLVERLFVLGEENTRMPLELSQDAYASIERDLLKRLTALGEQVLYEEFRRSRPSEEDLRLLFLGSGESAGKRRYNDFVRQLRDERLFPLFRKYPVLARLVAIVIDQWVAAMGEFIRRMNDDAALVHAMSAPAGTVDDAETQASLRVTRVLPGLSDPHNGGRMVIAVHFGNGRAVIYKPKQLATEVAYNRLLEWCNAHGVTASQRALRCWDRGEYGWEEYAEHRPCVSKAERHRFYERAGSLLCVLHALRLTDAHRDNLIACGEFPVLVDGETVMHAETPSADASLVRPEESDFLESVVRTGLLPTWHVNPKKRLVMDISALGGSGRDQSRVVMREWQAINTDDMHLAPHAVGLSVSGSETGVEGTENTLSDYVEDIARGFRETYRNIVRHRTALLAAEGPLEPFRKLNVRFIFRPTVVYAAMLQNALAPQYLGNGIDRSIALDAVARAFLEGDETARVWPIARAELRALERLDIPYFVAPCDSQDLTLDQTERIGAFFVAPSFRQVVSRITSMNDADLELQTMIIRGTFAARVAQLRENRDQVASENALARATQAALSSSELANEARAIAERVRACALRAPDGALHWLGLRAIEGSSRYQLAPLNDSLYDGNSGIALFLASLARLDNACGMGDIALAAIARIRSHLRNPLTARALVEHGTIGGALGLGSIIYALAKIGALLEDASVLRDAECAAELLTGESIGRDAHFDVMAGSAGAILGLLAAERTIASGAALENAIACGHRLVEQRVPADGSPRAWCNLGPVPLTGFSHGAAGIAYALLRLYEVTQQDEFLAAAREGIEYERRLFDVSAGNWPDLREHTSTGERRFAFGWCHGAPGIGLARLGALQLFNDETVRHEVDAAVRTTIACDTEGVDHLCCGTMGRLETLTMAGAELARGDLQALAARSAATVVHRSREFGGYRLAGLAEGALCPGLFSGLSGIGYQLLRLAYPEQVPSVLLWH